MIAKEFQLLVVLFISLAYYHINQKFVVQDLSIEVSVEEKESEAPKESETQEDRNSFVRETASCSVVTFNQVQKSCPEHDCQHVLSIRPTLKLHISACTLEMASKVKVSVYASVNDTFINCILYV